MTLKDINNLLNLLFIVNIEGSYVGFKILMVDGLSSLLHKSWLDSQPTAVKYQFVMLTWPKPASVCVLPSTAGKSRSGKSLL